MDSITKQHLRSIATLSLVLAVLAVGSHVQTNQTVRVLQNGYAGWTARLGTVQTYSQKIRSISRASSQEERIAIRLQERLRKRGNRMAPPLSKVVMAVKQRQELLGKHIDVAFVTQDNVDIPTWNVSPQRYPLWLEANFGATSASFRINTDNVAQSIEEENVVHVDPPTHAVLKQIHWKKDEDSVSRVDVEGIAKSGYMVDTSTLAQKVASAITSNDTDVVEVELTKVPGRIVNMTGLDLGDLTLWSEGISNFTGSTYARQKNVRKALDQHVNNTLVMPGETFSFNSTLGGPVSQGNGWHMAKVIFNGGDLEYAPGGGICQASTTVFRAIVNAGFPVVERRAHSLFVTYYEKFGVGIDATIFPGSQDLVFTNDSEHPLIIQSYTDGYDAHVKIFGTPDNRTVALEGPYFTKTAPEGFTYNGRQIASNEIVWVQNVTYPNGETREYKIGSRYKTMPQSLAAKYPPQETVHAAAPVASLDGKTVD